MGLVTSLYVVDGDTREKLKTRVKSGKKLKEKIPPKIKWATVLKRQFARVYVNWPALLWQAKQTVLALCQL